MISFLVSIVVSVESGANMDRQKELEMLTRMKEKEGVVEDEDKKQDGMSTDTFSRVMKDNRIDMSFQESLAINSANAIMSKLRFQMEPFRVVTDEKTAWEEKSAVDRLVDKLKKNKRNKLWQRRKRRRIAEKLAQVGKICCAASWFSFT